MKHISHLSRYLWLFLMILGKIIYAQTPTNQDCLNAIPVCQNIYSQPNSYVGVGNIPNEISPGISCLGSGELNDVWYVMTIQQPGNLCFSITPNTLSNDYDWAVYNLTNNPCSDIATNASLEVSCNYSGVSGVTGANGLAGAQNNPCIPVLAGQTYVLNVSNFSSSQSGYTLNFSASTAVIFDNVPPQLINATNNCGSSAIVVSFSENVLCNTVQPTDFILTGPGGPFTVTAANGAACALGATSEDDYTLTVSPAPTIPGIYTFALVGSVTDNCGNVTPSDTVLFSYGNITLDAQPDTLCGGASTTIQTSLGTTGLAGYTFSWVPGGANTPSITTSPSTTSTYSAFVTDLVGCVKSASINVTVIPDPIFDFTISNTTVCDTASVTITFSSISGTLTNWTPNWDLAGATVLSGSGYGPYQVTWAAAGTKNLSLFLNTQNGCLSDTVTHSLTVVPKPIFNFQMQNAGCLQTNIPVTYSGGAPATSTPNWIFNNATVVSGTGTGPYQLSWNTPNLHNVSLYFTSIEGCVSDTVTNLILIEPKPNFDFATSDSTTCGSNPLNISLTTSAPIGGTPTWNFNGGNIVSGSGIGPYQVSWGTSGIKNIDLFFTSTLGCLSDVVSHPIEVITIPSANFTPSAPAVCFGFPISYTYTGTVIDPAIQTFSWNFGSFGVPNTASTQNASCVSQSSGNQTVTLTVDYRGCINESSVIVQTYDEVVVEAGAPQAFCNLGVQLSANALTGLSPYNYVWSCDQPAPVCNLTSTTIANPWATPSVTSYFYVVATDAHNCVSKADSVLITKYAMPIASFTYQDNCENEVLQLNDLSQINGSNIVAWVWDLGDGGGSYQQNPEHAYLTGAGAYNVTLIVSTTENCKDTLQRSINILPTPKPSFTSTVNCQGDPTQFTDATTIHALGNLATSTYNWNMAGFGNVTNTANPNFIFPVSGLLPVTLTVTSDSGCTRSITKNVEVTPIPAPPVVKNDSICASQNAILEVFTPTGIKVEWFYDINDQTPFLKKDFLFLNNVAQTTTYYVQSVSNIGCRSAKVPITAQLFDEQDLVLNIEEILEMPQAQIKGSYTSSIGLTQWNWDFGNGDNSTLPSPIYEYSTPGRYLVALAAEDANGCELKAQKVIEVVRVITSSVPTAFSPNGDGINDVLKVSLFNISSMEFRIYDRWGTLVFQTNDPSKAWDGKNLKGQNVPEGVYTFVLQAQAFDGNSQNKEVGTITLLR
ncbi:MAG: PKD domain-containing protein [Bacteroidia bacterium]